MEIEPGISAGSYTAKTAGISYAFNVRPGSPWHEIVAAAREKLQALRIRAAVIDTGSDVEIRDSLTDEIGTTYYAVLAGTSQHGIWHESELDFTAGR